MDDLVFHGSLVAFHKNQLDCRADNMPLNDTVLYHLINVGTRDMDATDKPWDASTCSIVMDMVFFRMIFFELFSFLHVHAPYPQFRLLTNLGKTPRQDKTLEFVRPINNGTKETSSYCVRATLPTTLPVS